MHFGFAKYGCDVEYYVRSRVEPDQKRWDHPEPLRIPKNRLFGLVLIEIS